MISGEKQRIAEIQRTYVSYEWLIIDDIQHKRWDKLEDRLEAMEREMQIFAGKKLASEFMANLKLPFAVKESKGA